MLIWQMSTDLDMFQAAYKNKASFFHLEVPLSVHLERPNLGMNINEMILSTLMCMSGKLSCEYFLINRVSFFSLMFFLKFLRTNKIRNKLDKTRLVLVFSMSLNKHQ